jgi:hypothetical protein
MGGHRLRPFLLVRSEREGRSSSMPNVHRICSVADCPKAAGRRGWCSAHYSRWRRHGDPTVRVRARPLAGREDFFSRATERNGCLEWDGAVGSFGYGRVANRRTHRVAWEFANGPIPDGLLVCHACDNRKCVKPDHLFLGTMADNMQDMLKKGRQAKGIANGNAKLTASAVRAIRASSDTEARIAETYGVSKSAINHVRNWRTWRHVK